MKLQKSKVEVIIRSYKILLSYLKIDKIKIRGKYMKLNWKVMGICVLIPIAVGQLAAFLSLEQVKIFADLEKPPFAPPAWLFAPAWIVFYTCMGISSYLIYTSNKKGVKRDRALIFYAIQLAVNFFWTLIFFNMGQYYLALAWIIFLGVLIILTMKSMLLISKTAFMLMIPYLCWIVFATYLNLGIALLN